VIRTSRDSERVGSILCSRSLILQVLKKDVMVLFAREGREETDPEGLMHFAANFAAAGPREESLKD
jgi:hypothetical protein